MLLKYVQNRWSGLLNYISILPSLIWASKDGVLRAEQWEECFKCCIRNHKRPKVASQRPTATRKSNYIALSKCFETHFAFGLYTEMNRCRFLTIYKRDYCDKEWDEVQNLSPGWRNISHEKVVLQFHIKWGWFWKLHTSHLKYWNMNWDVQERKGRW